MEIIITIQNRQYSTPLTASVTVTPLAVLCMSERASFFGLSERASIFGMSERASFLGMR